MKFVLQHHKSTDYPKDLTVAATNTYTEQWQTLKS